MSSKTIQNVVNDWGGFERLIAQLHETGEVKVERDVVLLGRSGASRQIDVLVRHTQGLYEHLIVVECKYWKRQVSRLHVDALATTVREVGAARGVIFSTKGFQAGAVTQAKHDNIDLFRLREPTDQEWGLPGRHVDLWLHVVALSCGRLEMPGALLLAPPTDRPLQLNIRMGADRSKTPVKIKGKPDTTLEELVAKVTTDSGKLAYHPIKIDFGDRHDGDVKYVIRVNIKLQEPVIVLADGLPILAPLITFLLGLKVSQSRLEIDRGSKYAFVLAVEDCIQRTVTLATRETNTKQTELTPLHQPSHSSEEILQNGSLITVWTGPLIAFDEFDGLEPDPKAPERQMKLDVGS